MSTAAPSVHSIRIRAFRAASGLSLRALAELSGLRHVRIWEIEHGQPPNARELQLIAVALGVPVGHLEPGGGDV